MIILFIFIYLGSSQTQKHNMCCIHCQRLFTHWWQRRYHLTMESFQRQNRTRYQQCAWVFYYVTVYNTERCVIDISTEGSVYQKLESSFKKYRLEIWCKFRFYMFTKVYFFFFFIIRNLFITLQSIIWNLTILFVCLFVCLKERYWLMKYSNLKKYSQN